MGKTKTYIRNACNNRCTKKIYNKRNKNTSIESLPHELVTEILALTAASSFTGLFAAKLSCKFFNRAADNNYVYRLQKISTEECPLFSWKKFSNKDAVNSFWKRCIRSHNLDALYIQGVVDYFGRSRQEKSGLSYLNRAAELGNINALYTLGIIMLLSQDDEDNKKGLGIIGEVKKSNKSLRECREKLKLVLQRIFQTDQIRRDRRTYCLTRENHVQRSGWEGYDEDYVQCDACRCEKEVDFFCSWFCNV